MPSISPPMASRQSSGSKRKRKQDAAPANNSSDSSDREDFSDEEGGLRVDGIYIPPPAQPTCSMQTTGPRLIITHIENYFFKSYAGKQVLGPFHKVSFLTSLILWFECWFNIFFTVFPRWLKRHKQSRYRAREATRNKAQPQRGYQQSGKNTKLRDHSFVGVPFSDWTPSCVESF